MRHGRLLKTKGRFLISEYSIHDEMQRTVRSSLKGCVLHQMVLSDLSHMKSRHDGTGSRRSSEDTSRRSDERWKRTEHTTEEPAGLTLSGGNLCRNLQKICYRLLMMVGSRRRWKYGMCRWCDREFFHICWISITVISSI